MHRTGRIVGGSLLRYLALQVIIGSLISISLRSKVNVEMAAVGTQPLAAAMSESKPPRAPAAGAGGPGHERGPGVGRISASGNLDAYLSAVREALQKRTYAGLVSPLEEELEEELDNLSIVDEPNVDLSVPAPGSGDTFSNAAPHEFRKGRCAGRKSANAKGLLLPASTMAVSLRVLPSFDAQHLHCVTDLY